MYKKLTLLVAAALIIGVAYSGIASAFPNKPNQSANLSVAKLERFAKKEMAKKNRNTRLEMKALQNIVGLHANARPSAKRSAKQGPKWNCGKDPAFTPANDNQYAINWRWNGKFVAKPGNTGIDPKLLAANGVHIHDFLDLDRTGSSVNPTFRYGETIYGSDVPGYESTLTSIQICYAVFKTDKIGEVLLAKSKWLPVRTGSAITYDPAFSKQNQSPGTYTAFEGMQVIANLNK